MRFYIDKSNKNFIECNFNNIKILSINDIFTGAGEILKASQEWESVFKIFCELNKNIFTDLEKATLGNMNYKLKDNNILNEDEYNIIKKVIDIRNEFCHHYFLDKDALYPFNEVEETLNSILYIIWEATDFIQNKIDNLNRNSFGLRKTILK